ncbi:hypothetical protein D9M68_660290 [compost metagenome]
MLHGAWNGGALQAPEEVRRHEAGRGHVRVARIDGQQHRQCHARARAHEDEGHAVAPELVDEHAAREHREHGGVLRQRGDPAHLAQREAARLAQVGRQPVAAAPEVGQRRRGQQRDEEQVPRVQRAFHDARHARHRIAQRRRLDAVAVPRGHAHEGQHQRNAQHDVEHAQHVERAVPLELREQIAHQRIAHRQAQARAHVHQRVGLAVLVALEVRLDVRRGQREQRPFRHAQQHARGQQQAVAVEHRRGPGHHAPQHEAVDQAAPHAEQRRAERREHEGRDAVAQHEGRGQQALAHAVGGVDAHMLQEGRIGDQHRDVDAVHIRDRHDHEQRDHAVPTEVLALHDRGSLLRGWCALSCRA